MLRKRTFLLSIAAGVLAVAGLILHRREAEREAARAQIIQWAHELDSLAVQEPDSTKPRSPAPLDHSAAR